jgi:site-specific recombinase XerD
MAGVAVVPVQSGQSYSLGPLEDVRKRTQEFIHWAKSPATIRAYKSDWRDFETWCCRRGLRALPADEQTVSFYLSDLADRLKPASLQRRAVAISQGHRIAGFDTPTQSATVRNVMSGIRRRLGVAQVQKSPLLTADLRKISEGLPDSLIGLRDRALLLIGFAGAFRRSELVGLNVEDVSFTEDGAVILLRRSKTDQEGEGRKVGVPFGSNPATCPVRALRAWLQAAGIEQGAIFRGVNRHGRVSWKRLSGEAVALIVKKHTALIGKEASDFSGHSLRSGLVTAAAIAGVPERIIARTTGHRSLTILGRYIRDASLFRQNAASQVGL